MLLTKENHYGRVSLYTWSYACLHTDVCVHAHAHTHRFDYTLPTPLGCYRIWIWVLWVIQQISFEKLEFYLANEIERETETH